MVSARSSGAAVTAGGRAGSPTTSAARSRLLPEIARDELGLPPLALGGFGVLSRVRPRAGARSTFGAKAMRPSAAGARAGRRRRAPAPPAACAPGPARCPGPRTRRAVRRAIDYIRAGDVFQVNLAQRLSDALVRGPVRPLRAVCGRPVRRPSWRSCGSAAPMSSRPRRSGFCAAAADRSRPARSRARARAGGRAREDRLLADELRRSGKDRAENVMIADLARNDLGRVARYGSVNVRQLCGARAPPRRSPPRVGGRGGVRARGLGRRRSCARRSRPARSQARQRSARWRSSRSSSPCAAASTAAASAGSTRRATSSCRSRSARLLPAQGELTLHVGGAVVADSDPALEWQETMHKAARLLAAAGGELREPGRPSRRRGAGRRLSPDGEGLAQRRARRRRRRTNLACRPRLPARRRRVRDAAHLRPAGCRRSRSTWSVCEAGARVLGICECPTPRRSCARRSVESLRAARLASGSP